MAGNPAAVAAAAGILAVAAVHSPLEEHTIVGNFAARNKNETAYENELAKDRCCGRCRVFGLYVEIKHLFRHDDSKF